MTQYLIRILVLFIVTFGLSCGILLPQSAPLVEDNTAAAGGKSACQQRTCEQVTGQAESLFKLALLPDFVSQTLLLITELMKDMDKEMSRSATSMLKYVGPECGQTYDILKEVIQKQRTRTARASSEISQGIGVVGQEESMLDKGGQSYGANESGGHLTTEDSSSYGVQHQGSFSSQQVDDSHEVVDEPHTVSWSSSHQASTWQPLDSQGKQLNVGSSHSTKTSSQGSYGSGSGYKYNSDGSQNSYGGSSGYAHHGSGSQNKYQGNSGQGYHGSSSSSSSSSSSGQGHYGTQSGGRSFKSGGSGTTGYQGGASTNQGFQGGFHISSLSKTSGSGSSCRGVEKGTPFWVPGLDQWCVINCEQGYCPKTHCVCP